MLFYHADYTCIFQYHLGWSEVFGIFLDDSLPSNKISLTMQIWKYWNARFLFIRMSKFWLSTFLFFQSFSVVLTGVLNYWSKHSFSKEIDFFSLVFADSINNDCSYFSFFLISARKCSYDVLKYRSNLSLDVLINEIVIKENVYDAVSYTHLTLPTICSV